MAVSGLPIVKLAELLRENEEESDQEDENSLAKGLYQTPGTIGAIEKSQQTGTKEVKCNEDGNRGKDIWEESEIAEDNFDDRDLDPRPSPEYETMFKQRVTTDDVFLGMSGKNSSTACCEDLLVKIQLPETSRTDIDLDVQDTFLDCRSPKYRLALHLPHRVDSKNGKADWDNATSILTISLPLNRDFDFINK